ncbi:SpaA isopeptide-forming pilin-related protein [Bifidobacterium biavatii]|uniref:Fimbrial subunit FimA n=1 Tax=Bifidobacterium biavatii DSM 23969 TaxID=1437608 RepID=A0A086ZHU2_9BIFI|nr:SpaA isopeptide-forming pilin-related protein [Bifidobacterium biavatii]KFI46092.1 fimbrial subunit FimA [Bifidobacterium biavatii DSM 23969]
MNIRKPMALLTAMAALLGGLAFGATAHADEGTTVTTDVTFTFTADNKAQLENRDLKAYKIADFVNYGTTDKPTYGVKTAANANRDKLTSALTTAGFQNIPTDNSVDLMAWSLGQKTTKNDQGTVTQVEFNQGDTGKPWGVGTDSVSRKFADALKEDNPFYETKATTAYAVQAGKNAEGKYTATVTLPAGIYLFLDEAASTNTVTQAIPMIVNTGTLSDADTQGNRTLTLVTTAPTINMKNSAASEQQKTVDKTSASVGETLNYTLTYTIPNPVPEGFTLTFKDQPGKGLTYDPNSLKVTATPTNGTATELTANTDYTVTNNLTDNKGDGSKTIDIAITTPVTYAGQTITVTYQGTVNNEAETASGHDWHEVHNKLVDANGTPITDVTTKVFGFSFTKVDAQGKALQGAKFKLSVEDGQTGVLPTDTTNYPYENIESGSDGKVTFNGLKAGTYTVTETSPADGYLAMPGNLTFTVTISEDGAVAFGKDTWGLVSTDSNGAKVTNVKSVTELPLTGGMGIILFGVASLILASGAAILAVRARRTRMALTMA